MPRQPDKDSHPTTTLVETPLKEIRKTLPLRVLSLEDWDHWTRRGFVIVRQAVPRDNVERLLSLLFAFEGKDPDDPSTWHAPQRRDHKMTELNNTGMVEIYNHQYLWDNRMAQRVYDSFVDIWDREDLWVAIDRANLNPPRTVPGDASGFIHFDVDPSLRPQPIGVQGVLSLLPQHGDVGGFQCVPELFERYDAWAATQPADRDPQHPDVTGLEVVVVELDPGDLLIFNSLLPHGVRPNLSGDRFRAAQYISMYPADPGDAAEREERVRLWRERDHPKRDAFPGDPREWERNNAETAVLTPLGARLLGSESWV